MTATLNAIYTLLAILAGSVMCVVMLFIIVAFIVIGAKEIKKEVHKDDRNE